MALCNQSKTNRTPLKTIAWLLPFLWSKNTTLRLGLVASLLLTLLTIVSATCVPLLLKKIIDLFALGPQHGFAFMPLLFIGYGALWIFNQTIAQLSFTIIFRSAERGMRLLSLHIFQHLQSLSMRFHVSRSTGAVTSAIDRAQTGFDALFWGLTIFMVPLIVEMVIVITIFTYWYGITYSGILFLTVISYLMFSHLGMSYFDQSQETYNQQKARAGGIFIDSLLNIETVKYFHNQQYDFKRYNTVLQQQETAGIKLHTIDACIQCGQKVIVGTGLALLTWKSGNAVLAGTISVGDFVLINSYLLQFVMPLSSFGYIARQIRKGLNDLNDVIDLLAITPEIQDCSKAVQLEPQRARVIFNNVSFEYDEQRPIIKQISFCIPAGKTVAIVGPTGAGKSTITRLLFRCYDVTGGAIWFNDHDIRTVTQQSLHEAIGVVAQETNLFNDTLYYNIAYGRPTASTAEVEDAIDRAQLRNFINKLPDGHNTVVGERGLKLSGGEKQRVAIARVLLKNPTLYIFDEATSSLDTATEREIQEHLNQLAQEKTTLIIAHRLSTIIHADEIIVLDDGAIIERGTHKMLIDQQGVYAGLWHNQKKLVTQELSTSVS